MDDAREDKLNLKLIKTAQKQLNFRRKQIIQKQKKLI